MFFKGRIQNKKGWTWIFCMTKKLLTGCGKNRVIIIHK